VLTSRLFFPQWDNKKFLPCSPFCPIRTTYGWTPWSSVHVRRRSRSPFRYLIIIRPLTWASNCSLSLCIAQFIALQFNVWSTFTIAAACLRRSVPLPVQSSFGQFSPKRSGQGEDTSLPAMLRAATVQNFPTVNLPLDLVELAVKPVMSCNKRNVLRMRSTIWPEKPMCLIGTKIASVRGIQSSLSQTSLGRPGLCSGFNK
jgi:hypothetical protein